MGADVFIRAATPADAAELSESVRPADAAELAAALGVPPLTGLMEALRVSRASFAFLINGEVAALFGVHLVPDAPVAVPWALTGNLVSKHRRTFLGWSPMCVQMLWARTPRGISWMQFVDARYAAALRWVRWLGFAVLPPIPYGVEGLPFHPIRLEAPRV